VKLIALLGHHLAHRHHGRYYAIGQNLRHTLRAAYDAALARVDVLAMPTTPQTALPFDASRSLADDLFCASNMIQNTCPFDLTGHPALSMPCGTANGLPVGLTLVARHLDEATLFRVAPALETAT
jgi:amidase